MKGKMLPKNIEHKLISELKDKFHEELHSIVLFGSYARGTAQKYSDIDILIILVGNLQTGQIE